LPKYFAMRLTGIFLLFFVSLVLAEKSYALPTKNNVTDTTDHQLKILSWNIYMLPKIVVRKGKEERAHAIVEQIKLNDFDVIVFQEAFLPKARKIIGEGLAELYPHHYGPANNSSNIKTNSGVWVISKIPLRQLETIQFRNCIGFDCFARKGAILLEGDWEGKSFQVLGTHLQADQYTEIREKQMDQIYLELLNKYRREDVPQIICGDLNTEEDIREHYCAMLDCLDAENGDISGIEKCTYDGVNNPIAQSYGAKSKTTYDYILVRKNGSIMSSIKRFVSVLKKGKKHLSDHYGVVCELKF